MDFRVRAGGRAAPQLPGGAAGPAARPWPRAFLFLTLICLLVQSTAVQSHVHPGMDGTPPQVSAWGASGQQQLSAPGPAEADGYCLLCWEQAMAGHYVPPAAEVVVAPPAMVLWIVAPTMTAFGLRSHAHAWLSRAPPE